jgi:phosphoglucosamine mutase
MKQGMAKFPQRMINVRVNGQRDLETSRPIQDGLRAAEAALNGRGRVLLRPSGTEPVVRVMVEGEDGPLVNSVAQALAEVVEQTLGAPA